MWTHLSRRHFTSTLGKNNNLFLNDKNRILVCYHNLSYMSERKEAQEKCRKPSRFECNWYFDPMLSIKKHHLDEGALGRNDTACLNFGWNRQITSYLLESILVCEQDLLLSDWNMDIYSQVRYSFQAYLP